MPLLVDGIKAPDMKENYIMHVCKAFSPRLKAMIGAQDGHFEK